jgi:hypothetical protein
MGCVLIPFILVIDKNRFKVYNNTEQTLNQIRDF